MVLGNLDRWRHRERVHVGVVDCQHQVLQFLVVFKLDYVELNFKTLALGQVPRVPRWPFGTPPKWLEQAYRKSADRLDRDLIAYP